MKRILTAALCAALVGCAAPYEGPFRSTNDLVKNNKWGEAAERYHDIAITTTDSYDKTKAQHRYVMALIADGQYDKAKQNAYLVTNETTKKNVEIMTKYPGPNMQKSAREILLTWIAAGEEKDRNYESPVAKEFKNAGKTLLFIGAGVTGAKIHSDSMSSDPTKAARAKQNKENLTVAIDNANKDLASSAARKTNDANKCLFASSRESASDNSITYTNGCDVPVYLIVVHHTPNKTYATQVYFQRLSARGKHIVLTTDGGATHAEVTSCFSQPVRQFDQRDNGYYGLCPDTKN